MFKLPVTKALSKSYYHFIASRYKLMSGNALTLDILASVFRNQN
jgi:hypothetical protein